MSIEGRNLTTLGCKAGGNIAENAAVTLDTSATGDDIVVTQAGAGDAVFGVNAYAVSSGGDATVVVEGIGKLVKLGATPGAVVVGGQVKADASGLAVFTSTARDNVIGTVLSPASTTAGDYVPVLLQPLASVKAAS